MDACRRARESWAILHKIEMVVEYFVLGGEFDPFTKGKSALHFTAKALIQTVVIVGVKKAAALEVATQTLDFSIVKSHVSMPGEVKIRVTEKIFVQELHALFCDRHANARVVAKKTEEVGQRRGIAVPVAAAAVLQSRNSEHAAGRRFALSKNMRRPAQADQRK